MSQSVIEAKDIRRKFKSGERTIEVLRGASLSLQKGSSVSIRGESGSGKSTLLNIIAGLEVADSGTVAWGDTIINNVPKRTLAPRRSTHIGMVFQSFYLIPELNALENVLMPSRIQGRTGKAERNRAKNLLERVGLGERLYGTTSVLSGGERQRIAVARALMNRPAVILADEPTGNLDERTGVAVMQILLKVCEEEGTSLVLVTHNAEFAKLTERALVLYEGILEVAGSVQATPNQ